MGSNIHRLKLVQPYFNDVVSGAKTFEVRVNDRDFKVGDVLELLEYDPETTWLTDRSVRVRVTYILDNTKYVLPGTVIMAIELEGGSTGVPSEREYKVERYLLTHPEHDPFQLRVINSVNLPNNPDFESLIEVWIIDNYGNLDGWEYYCLSRTKMRTIGAGTDAPEL
ncbi:DUF3850 domain-containing protein [Paenibacillus wenxiniae]|uniref:DUF3850 domain-containing protein n=1 Tax=Paenibacillus wenxiniae TaxID=1636843 RepID=A0ABW4RD25_9BACL